MIALLLMCAGAHYKKEKGEEMKKEERIITFSHGTHLFHLFTFSLFLFLPFRYGLALDGSHAGKHLAFDSLEQGTAAGGDVAYLVLKAELVDAGYAVAAADE